MWHANWRSQKCHRISMLLLTLNYIYKKHEPKMITIRQHNVKYASTFWVIAIEMRQWEYTNHQLRNRLFSFKKKQNLKEVIIIHYKYNLVLGGFLIIIIITNIISIIWVLTIHQTINSVHFFLLYIPSNRIAIHASLFLLLRVFFHSPCTEYVN